MVLAATLWVTGQGRAGAFPVPRPVGRVDVRDAVVEGSRRPLAARLVRLGRLGAPAAVGHQHHLLGQELTLALKRRLALGPPGDVPTVRVLSLPSP